MPPKKGGKKFIKKNDSRDSHDIKILMKNPEAEEYALVTKKLGSGRFLLKMNMKETEVIGRICGKMRHGRNKKSNWVDVDSIVLVGMRDFQDNMVDIVHVYDQTEIRQLRKSGELIEEQRHEHKDEDVHEDNENCAFDFDEI